MENYVLSSPAPWYNDREKIKRVVIKDGVTSIGDWAFRECSNLTSVTIPNSVTSIRRAAFGGCSGLTSVIIPESVTSIGESAFLGCSSLTSITIPNSVTSIGSAAFEYCENLTSITIPNSVTSIGDGAFFKCKGLTSITFKGSTPPTFGNDVFDYVDKSIPVYVPANSIEAYKEPLEGLDFSNIQANPKQLFLTDNDSYTRGSETDGMEASYTRNFTNTKWQALYLPFSLSYDDWKDDFEIAYISAIRQKDNNDDGTIDETTLEVIKMNSGSTVPNTPYLIRAKETGEKTLSVENTTVYPAENNSVDCTTTTTRFTFTGTYKSFSLFEIYMHSYYVVNDNKLNRVTSTFSIKPYYWYMRIGSRNSSYATYNPAKDITISVLGEEEATGISQMQMENRQSSVYDINGRKVNENSLKPGMYIKNGKKIIVK